MAGAELGRRKNPVTIRQEALMALLLTVLKRAIGLGISLLAGAVVILEGSSMLRGLRKRAETFSHPDFEPIATDSNRLQLYGDGKDLYPAMLAAIEAASETIYLETFIWKHDELGIRFKDALIAKAERGVHVYLIMDALGTLLEPAQFKRFPPTVHAMSYQPFRRWWHVADPRHYAFEHRKLMVADGQVAFIGGFNLGSSYALSWRDTHLRIEGPAAAELAEDFAHFWNWLAPKQALSHRYPRRFDPSIRVHGTDAHRLTFPIRTMYIEAIDRAEERIWLTNAYFVPDGVLLESLRAAAQRGVDVRILVPWRSNHALVDWLARGYFAECLEAGIRMFAYQGMIHAKTCTIDGAWSTIGTANLDRLSSVGNYEINVEVYSADLARQMETLFLSDAAQSIELSAELWAQRPLHSTLGEKLLVPLRALV